MKILLLSGLKSGLRPGPKGNMGHVVRLKPETQMCSDTIGPHNSPPLIRARFLGTGNESRSLRADFYQRSSKGGFWTVEEPINALSKGTLRLTIRSAAIIT